MMNGVRVGVQAVGARINEIAKSGPVLMGPANSLK